MVFMIRHCCVSTSVFLSGNAYIAVIHIHGGSTPGKLSIKMVLVGDVLVKPGERVAMVYCARLAEGLVGMTAYIRISLKKTTTL